MAEQKEEVVISGIGGVFPECENVDEFRDLLFDKINGVTIDSRRWNPNEVCAIDGIGKLKHVDKFDATFFMLHPQLAIYMDPLTRVFLERSIEAIIDAGLSTSDLHGTNTAVFSSWCNSDTEMFTVDCVADISSAMIGRSRTMQANRVSYILNLTGPSFTVDGGWICSSDSLEKAKNMIENGIVPAAIVGVTNLILRPESQFQHQGLNRLTKSDQTKPFSADADGYNRSEACVVMLLQRASEAKRSYGTLVSVKSKQFGDHEGHLMEHVGSQFKSVLLDTYREANIDPATIEYVEAYGSGIKVEDTMELNVMEEVFCTAGRKTPLKVGSVKSNVGHCEVSNHFVSIVKAAIALESGYIPPNIHCATPNENVEALRTGKIQVVTEKTPLVDDLVGVSSFGFRNAFSHVVLRRNKKVKRNLETINGHNYIPRLLFASGRTEENARETIIKIKKYANDPEFVALVNDVFTKNINAHFYRCFSIYPSLDESRIDDVWSFDLKKRPVWFVFSGMGSQWQGMGTHLLNVPIFARAVDKCHNILAPRGLDIRNILTSQDPKLFNNILNSFVGIAAVQIGLVDVLRALEIVPDGIIGHSVGELGCAYADGCFTAEEMILAAYARGRASLETKFIPGTMAAVGLGYNQIKNRLPWDIDVACRNSSSSCTISGPANSVDQFVSTLKSNGVFAKVVDSAGIAYHSRYIQSAGPTLLRYLKEVIKKPKPRSSKWISSSLPEAEWNSDVGKYSSPEYHTNNLLSSVLFEEVIEHVPHDAIVIEIAPHGLLQAILKSALPDTVTNIPLTKKVFGDSVRFLLNAIGKMYVNGLNPTIQEMYPKVDFPVGRGTPSLWSFPLWDHAEQMMPFISELALKYKASGERYSMTMVNENIHLIQHRIHGHYVFPLSYILLDVWKMFVEINDKIFNEECVQFDDLKFKNDFKIHPTYAFEKYQMIQKGTGRFEYCVDGAVVLSGHVSFLDGGAADLSPEAVPAALSRASDDYQGSVGHDELYAALDNNGLDLGDGYRNIGECGVYDDRVQGSVRWDDDWIYFVDGLLRFPSLERVDAPVAEAPASVRQIRIDPVAFENRPTNEVFVDYNKSSRNIVCGGVTISDVKLRPLTSLSEQKSAASAIRLEERTFVHFKRLKCKSVGDFIDDAMDVILETEKLGSIMSNRKIVLCVPQRQRDDSVSIECTQTIRQIIENQLTTDSAMLNWDDVKYTSGDDHSARFIAIVDVDRLSDTTRALTDKKCCFVVVCAKRTLQEIDGWKIITQHKFDDDNCLALMKKKTTVDGNCVFIKQNSEDYELKIWKALENLEGPIYIVSKTETLDSVRKTLMKFKSPRLRFLFILDPNAPEFESNRSFYAEQLSVDLTVNIYKNGGWGSYKNIPLKDSNENVRVTDAPVVRKTPATNAKKKLTIKRIGLNFNDLVVEDDTENLFGPLEYSGVLNDNTRIMGITSFVQMSSQSPYDPLLSWPVPSKWSLEDAATIPLSYALTYYALKVLSSLQAYDSVLVTSGLHPIGRAMISISLAEKCKTIVVVVESHQQADQLSKMFPELPRSGIVLNKNNNFDVPARMMTKKKGVDIIFNLQSGDAFQAALRSLARGGQFFHFTKSDMKNQENMGLRVFLNSASFSVVSPQLLLDETERNKDVVRRALSDGLKAGAVNPFHEHAVVTKSSAIGKTIFDTMRSASSTFRKVVMDLNDGEFEGSDSRNTFNGESYRCRGDRVYIVIGDKSNWTELVEWLVERGARQIVIAVNRFLMSSIASKMLNRLVSRNVSLRIESDLNFETKEETLDWLGHVTSSADVLGSLFIIDQFNVTKLRNLRWAFEKHPYKTEVTPFVCISCDGDQICAELKSSGLKALNVSLDEDSSSRSKIIAKILPSLDALLREPNTWESSSFVCSTPDSYKVKWSRQINDVIKNFFPGCVDELQLLHDNMTAREAGFVEVQTHSPRFSHLKSVLPVFVVPGFKPQLIETLYKRLLFPVFEARLPEHFGSIDEVSEILVDKLKSITDQGYVSLIGESWGGIIALKMAQILEARGTLVTVTLLEGDPEILTELAESFLSNENFINKLNRLYGSFSNEPSKRAVQHRDGESQSRNATSPADRESLANVTKRTLNAIRSRLLALLDTKPLTNKLQTKVVMFRYERSSKIYKIAPIDYCVDIPLMYNMPVDNYEQLMANEEMLTIVGRNVAHLYPTGVELSLREKYKNFFFFEQKCVKVM